MAKRAHISKPRAIGLARGAQRDGRRSLDGSGRRDASFPFASERELPAKLWSWRLGGAVVTTPEPLTLETARALIVQLESFIQLADGAARTESKKGRRR